MADAKKPEYTAMAPLKKKKAQSVYRATAGEALPKGFRLACSQKEIDDLLGAKLIGSKEDFQAAEKAKAEKLDKAVKKADSLAAEKIKARKGEVKKAEV